MLPKLNNLTRVFEANAAAYYAGKRIIINQGGTSSSKTFSILQLFIYLTIGSLGACISSVVSESLPHLKLGCLRDFKTIMGTSFCEKDFNYTDNIYNFGEGRLLEFFSADNAGKVHGPRRNNLFINEVNNVPKGVREALSVRTQGIEEYDYNPTGEFYLMEEIGKPSVEFIKSTYLDAKQFLPQSIIYKIESRKDRDPNWWRVYGLGEVGNMEGLVHSVFNQEAMPEGKGRVFYGLDFGYTNDPTALVKCIEIGEDLYCDELIYETGLNNQQIAKRLETIGLKKNETEIFADNSEPKSIDEIHLCGWNIKPAPKGPDSVLNGIQRINQFRQHWTNRSLNAIKEMRSYRYIQDKDGKLTNQPRDDFNHAMDARRYAVIGKGLDRPVQIF
jgi:phage terminase large subunit